jgi:endonuclease I
MRLHLERLLRIVLLLTLVYCEPKDGEDKDKDKKTGLTVDQMHPYYALNDADLLADSDLKLAFHKMMAASHIVEQGKRDQAVADCAEVELSDGQTCVKHKSLGYKVARKHLFGQIHLETDEDGEFFVKDIYCLKDFTNADFDENEPKLGQLSIPWHQKLNAEHVWPQSRFKDNKGKDTGRIKDMKKSDLHILYPSESKINGGRGNYQFGEVEQVTKSYDCSEGVNGKIKLEDGSLSETIYFEPPAESKGNIARSIFYFSARYNVPVFAEEEAFLRKWHEEDPIDEMELKRNEAIYELQNVRNPFIDHPELVEMIKDF